MYLTIGNIPKDIRTKPSRHAQVLLGYLPTTKLDQIKSKASRRRALANLFHAAMGHILEPLKTLGVAGIEMATGDGVVRRCHPVFAAFVGDYPEQVLVTCLKNGDCPTCPTSRDELGTGTVRGIRNIRPFLEIFNTLMEDNPVEFAKACVDAGIKPIYRPFWHGLPYVNIFQSITPDVLHQLYQGLLKHLVSWLKDSFGAAEIDARCRRMPPCHGTRLFTKGITTLSRVTGQEHRDMCRILLGLIVDLRLPDGHSPVRLIRAVRGMLDFLYLAQLRVHTMDSLCNMEGALAQFHENKHIFVDLGIRNSFNLPKLHNAGHYRWLIELFGTTDNYSTQTTERLHIDYAKDAYEATNHKEELIQMTTWLERKEKMFRHDTFIQWRLGVLEPPTSTPPHILMTKHPSITSITFDQLADDYGASDIINSLSTFIVKWNQPDLSTARIQLEAANVLIRFHTLPVYHKIRFSNRDLSDKMHNELYNDVAHVKPASLNCHGHTIPGRFDTVLVDCRKDAVFSGVHGKLTPIT